VKTLITNGQVWSEGQLRPLDLLISSEGRIEAMLAAGQVDSQAAGEVINAGGLMVLPGSIDIHAHIQDGAETFHAGSCAAARGGVTTVIDMPPFQTVIDRHMTLLRKAWGERECVTDFGLTGGIVIDFADLDHLDELAAAGVTQFKIFMLMNPPVKLLWEAVKKAAQTGLRLTVHMEEPACLGEVDWDDPLGFVKANPPAAENVAAAQLLEMARAAGAAIHVCHVSSSRTVELIAAHKAWGTCVSAETAPQYLLLNEADYLDQGERVISTPVLRKSEDQQILWQALRDGVLDCIISDHFLGALPDPAKPRPALKDAEPGIAALELAVPLMLEAALRGGQLGLGRLVEVMATRPAQLMKLDDRKGRIAVGMDADLIFVDGDSKWKVADLGPGSRISTLPYEGWTLQSSVRRTLVRGKTVWNGETILAEKGWGQYCGARPV
jgi:allantoinase